MSLLCGDVVEPGELELSCWLPGNESFLVPIEDGWDPDSGILSLADGLCRPLACRVREENFEASPDNVMISTIKQVSVSPDGKHAVVYLSQGDSDFMAGFIIDLEQGRAFASDPAFWNDGQLDKGMCMVPMQQVACLWHE